MSRWLSGGGLLAGATIAGAVLWGVLTLQTPDPTPGRALFEGQRPLMARIAGHEQALPAAAWRCVNCHAGAQPVGGLLSRDRLVELQPRRGGPASRYDAASLCRLLREGTDPAWVMVDRTMPRFDISATECEQLWHFLSRS